MDIVEYRPKIVKKTGRRTSYPGDEKFYSLYVTENKTAKEIAELYGIQETTVRGWVTRYNKRARMETEEPKDDLLVAKQNLDAINKECEETFGMSTEDYIEAHITSEDRKARDEMIARARAEVFGDDEKN